MTKDQMMKNIIDYEEMMDEKNAHIRDLERDLADCQLERDAREDNAPLVGALRQYAGTVSGVALWYLKRAVATFEFNGDDPVNERNIIKHIHENREKLGIPIAYIDEEEY